MYVLLVGVYANLAIAVGYLEHMLLDCSQYLGVLMVLIVLDIYVVLSRMVIECLSFKVMCC